MAIVVDSSDGREHERSKIRWEGNVKIMNVYSELTYFSILSDVGIF